MADIQVDKDRREEENEQTSVGGSVDGEKKRTCCWDCREQALPTDLGSGFWGTKSVVRKLDALLSKFGASSVLENDPLIEKKLDSGELEEGQPLAADEPRRREERCTAEVHGWGIALYSLAVFSLYALLLYNGWNATTELGEPVLFRTSQRFYQPDIARCGLEAINCRPFVSDWIPARCPRFPKTDDKGKPVVSGGAMQGLGSRYASESYACAAAIHQGVISHWAGGCFAFRFAGEPEFAPVTFAPASVSNGVSAKELLWHPKPVEIKAVDSSFCSAQPGFDAYSFFIFLIFALFLRPTKFQCVMFLTAEGFMYLLDFWRFEIGVEYDLPEEYFIYALNHRFGQLVFVLIPTAYVLYMKSIKYTIPDPKRYPIDIMLFYWVPFWVGIKLHHVSEIGFDASLTAKAFASPARVLGLISLAALGIPTIGAMMIAYYRAGALGRVMARLAAFVAVAVTLQLSMADYISLHVHHYFFGLVLAFFFQGRTKFRYAMIAQAVMFGVWINGVIIWESDPFFDQAEPPKPTPKPTPRPTGPPTQAPRQPVLWFTDVRLSAADELVFNWATEDVVFDDWNCSQVLLAEPSELGSDGSRLLTAQVDNLGIDLETEWITEELHQRRVLDILATPAPTLAPPPTPSPEPSKPLTSIFLNPVLVLQSVVPLSSDGETYSYTRSKLPAGVPFRFSVFYNGLTPAKGLRFRLDGKYTGDLFPSVTDRCDRVLAIAQALEKDGTIEPPE